MDGIAISGIPGCNLGFDVNTSAHYEVDEERLTTLRDQVIRGQCKLQRCEEVSLLWEKARLMEIPCVVKIVRNIHGENLMLPFAEFFEQCGEQKAEHLVQILWESNRLSPFLSLLPDLIEVSFILSKGK
jgi:hypothetical protein